MQTATEYDRNVVNFLRGLRTSAEQDVARLAATPGVPDPAFERHLHGSLSQLADLAAHSGKDGIFKFLSDGRALTRSGFPPELATVLRQNLGNIAGNMGDKTELAQQIRTATALDRQDFVAGKFPLVGRTADRPHDAKVRSLLGELRETYGKPAKGAGVDPAGAVNARNIGNGLKMLQDMAAAPGGVQQIEEMLKDPVRREAVGLRKNFADALARIVPAVGTGQATPERIHSILGQAVVRDYTALAAAMPSSPLAQGASRMSTPTGTPPDLPSIDPNGPGMKQMPPVTPAAPAVGTGPSGLFNKLKGLPGLGWVGRNPKKAIATAVAVTALAIVPKRWYEAIGLIDSGHSVPLVVDTSKLHAADECKSHETYDPKRKTTPGEDYTLATKLLLDQTMGNPNIATQLGVAPYDVQKILQHIRENKGCNEVAAAVAAVGTATQSIELDRGKDGKPRAVNIDYTRDIIKLIAPTGNEVNIPTSPAAKEAFDAVHAATSAASAPAARKGPAPS